MIFQHSSLTYCIPLVKDQSSFYEIRRRAIFVDVLSGSQKTAEHSENIFGISEILHSWLLKMIQL